MLFECEQDIALGSMLWLSHFFPNEDWSKQIRKITIMMLDIMWIDASPDGRKGFFCKNPLARDTKYAFTNYTISVGLQAAALWPHRVAALHRFFEEYRSGDEYDTDAITQVMACCSYFPGKLLKAYTPPPPPQQQQQQPPPRAHNV
eukprot:GEZU01019333.1.p2 GENE.GEZU01019333.1~~GEZU01019333.1.p2  ORF type:complete len:146 (+),score=32.93 GEZU01019333.1:233-670(+)